MTSSARWFLLLVLALLLGALSPFAAAPAEAQTTVWSATLTPHNLGSSLFGCLNTGQAGSPWYCSETTTLSDDGFTHDSTPYTFKGIYTNNGNIILRITTELPAAFVANASLVVGSTSYALSGATKGNVGVGSDTTYELDPTPEVNWTAGNQVSLGLSLTQTTTPSTDATLSAPTGLAVTPGNTNLALAWTAISGVTGYDVHFTSSTSVADDAAVGSTVGTEWVDSSHSGTTASLTISSLTNNTAYRVRVRGVNAQGAGGWAFGSGTPKASTTGSTDATLSALAMTDDFDDPIAFNEAFAPTTYVYTASDCQTRLGGRLASPRR